MVKQTEGLTDISISFHSLGFPSDPSGIFKKAYDRAAKVYGADRTLFTVNGTTGSNFMVFRALSKQFPGLRVLSQRNLHKSAIAACEDYNIDIHFLPMQIDSELQIFQPNTPEQIIKGLIQIKPEVLFLTLPTYEGLSCNLKSLIKMIRKIDNKVIIFIDEGWGAHLHFSKYLPDSAMAAGADISVQSVHKQGGGLQQTSLIHWKTKRLNSELVVDSYRHLLTTSPSFILLASIDAARETMERLGASHLKNLIVSARRLNQGLAEIPGLKVIQTSDLQKRYPAELSRDETKVLIDVSELGISGYQFGEILEHRYEIIVEKCDIQTVLLLVPLQSGLGDVELTIEAFRRIVQEKRQPEVKSTKLIKIPSKIVKKLSLQQVAQINRSQIKLVSLARSIGMISAENIVPYPPGIPMTIKGEVLTRESVSYYQQLKKGNIYKILSHDPKLNRVKVVNSGVTGQSIDRVIDSPISYK